ncbi:hypothetical protein GFY24_25855 [Nocardia sp. SYP-A9097]|uniref:poly(ethylene terephthalate) hydrolase family protein n=1 Tax=Nocardia sp. SYP-A9097 TaxID=2663237 RepID=UPI00129B8B6F|nr:hypothetical protein [Nocardia sp. SYP-A9097]MRH90821.1 hypothetical protein [Nocardia sp. SYP-A9097]
MALWRVLATALAAATMLAGSWTAVAAADDPPPTAQTVFGGDRPHPVATSVRTNPCQDSAYGLNQHIVIHLFGNRDDMTCTQAFPYGPDSPAGVNTYYPADIADTGSAPLIVLTGGFESSPGMYDRLARQWVSNGFVVVIAYEWFNSLAYVPAAALAVAMSADRDPASPLYQRIDLSRTIFAGHSAGGQASLQIATLLPPLEKTINPDLHVAGVLAIQPAPLAVGALINVPTLFLTGDNDFIVPDFAWVRWWQYNLTFNAPAWIANARGVSHFSVVDELNNYLSAGTAVAWLRYLAFDDESAKSYFVGPNWQLPTDKTYFSVDRNPLANSID